MSLKSDEYCPNCDNHFVIDALTPKAALKVEGEDTRVDSRYVYVLFRLFGQWEKLLMTLGGTTE